MNSEIVEIKNTYYEYISNVGPGLVAVALKFRQGNFNSALESLSDFAEGLEWLLKVEEVLSEQYIINSRIEEAKEFLVDINNALEMQDFTTVADIIEYEIINIFNSATEWQFSEKK